MQFGKHTPTEARDRGVPSAMATFTRGTVLGGTQWKFAFPNGYGASVINDGYGQEQRLYELAVLGTDGHITYSTPLTDDVLGWQSEEDIAAALDRIEALTESDIKAEAVRRLNAEIDEKRAQIAKIEQQIADLNSEVRA